jgi:hypothetical protein
MFIHFQPYPAEIRIRTLLDRIAVTNPWTDKRTPNVPLARARCGPANIEHTQRRPHGDGAHMTETSAIIKTSYVNCAD